MEFRTFSGCLALVSLLAGVEIASAQQGSPPSPGGAPGSPDSALLIPPSIPDGDSPSDSPTAPADEPQFAFESEFDLSLEELLATEITSVAGRAESILETPAAVTIITREEIRRSGHTSVVEALRLAPGVQVSRISANVWAVSVRGFNSRFSDKLLVLVDGRAVYNDLFAGVYWDENDIPIDEVQHIEVIRGPGATIWGANAVNGVINIVTRKAVAGEGARVEGVYGEETSSSLLLRYGDAISDGLRYRVFARALDHEEFELEDGSDAGDDWDQRRFGLRLDAEPWEGGTLFFQSHYYEGDSGTLQVQKSLTAPFSSDIVYDDRITGGHAILALEHGDPVEDWWRLQLLYDQAARRNPDNEQVRQTFEVDLRHRWSWGDRHRLIAGLGYRYRDDEIDGSFTVDFDPDSRSTEKYSAFIQDNILLTPETWELMLGTKVEENDYSGTEIQPAARLRWSPSERRTWWAAVSHAVRTPARLDEDIRFTLAVVPPPLAPIPTPARLLGYPGIDPEELDAFELGHRARVGERWNFDVTLFYFLYQDLITIGGPASSPFDQSFQNAGDAVSYGGEVSALFDVAPGWRLSGSWSYLVIDGKDAADQEEDDHPPNMAQLRSQWNPSEHFEVDASLSYVDRVPGPDVPSYFRLDLGLTWRPNDTWEVSLRGQNLTEESHLEGVDPFLQGALVEVERGAYLQVACEF